MQSSRKLLFKVNFIAFNYEIMIYLFIFISHIPYLATAGSARNNAKKRDKKEKRKRKNGSGLRAKPSTPTQVIDARMGEEEKSSNQKEEQKKETGNWPTKQLPGLFDHLLRPAWIIRLAYSETPLPQEKKYIFIYLSSPLRGWRESLPRKERIRVIGKL